MSPRTKANLLLSAAAITTLVALAAIASWYFTRSRNAWSSPNWPMFVGVHEGRVLFLSSLWTGGLSSSGWIYDALAFRDLGHLLPRYTRIGDTYSGTPPFNSLLYAFSVPIWYGSLPLAVLASVFARRSAAIRASGRNLCLNCGYPREGLNSAACPECGAARPQN